MPDHLALWIAVLVAVNAVGVALDLWMTQRGQARLYKSLQSWWKSVNDGSFADMPNRALRWFLTQEKRIFGNTATRFVVVSALVSVSLTTIALVWVETVIYYSPSDNFATNLFGAFGNVFTAQTDAFGSVIETTGLYMGVGYALNFVFDALTLLVTVQLLRLAVESTMQKALVLITIDGLFAIALAVLCGAVSGWLLFDERLNLVWGGDPIITETFYYWLRESVMNLSDYVSGSWQVPSADWDVSLGAYSATSLIPTLMYIACMACLFIAKPIARYISPIAAAVINRLIQHDPKHDADKFRPFTLLGVLLTAIGSVLGVISIGLKTFGAS